MADKISCCVRKRTPPGARVHVSAYVSHYVAKYERASVASFVAKLYSQDSYLAHFYCTDSCSQSVKWLQEEAAARRETPSRITVMPVGPLVGAWLRDHPLHGRSSLLSALPAGLLHCLQGVMK